MTFSLNIVSETADTINADRYFRFSLIDFLNLHRETFSLHCRAGCRRRTHLARQPRCRRRCSSRPQPVRSHRVRRQGQKGRVAPVDSHQMHSTGTDRRLSRRCVGVGLLQTIAPGPLLLPEIASRTWKQSDCPPDQPINRSLDVHPPSFGRF